MTERRTATPGARPHGRRPRPGRGWAALLFLLLALMPCAVSTAAPPESVAAVLDPILADARARGLPTETLSFAIQLPDGTLVLHRSDAPMAPASTLKLVSAAAALDLLGPDHALRTELWITGPVRDGTLHGDVVVVGGGDPATSGRAYPDDPVAELRPWVEALRARGIERIGGRIIGDDRYLAGPSRRDEWPKDQWHRWYCAPSGALNLNDNCVDVVIASHDQGPQVSLRPGNALFSVQNELRPTSEKGRHVYSVDRSVGAWQIRVGGRFWTRAGVRTEWVTVPDPTLAFLGAFRTLLAAKGIATHGEPARGALPDGAERLATIEHPVRDAIPILLKNSQNLYGDCLLRVTDREVGGDGSFDSAAESAARYLSSHVGATGASIRDGSGLSSENRIPVDALLQVLRRADRAEWGSILWESLPVAGVDGTLRKRFGQSPLKGRLRAKTGTISGVRGLAGGWTTSEGPVRFAALCGGPGARANRFLPWLEDALERVDALCGGAPAAPVTPTAEGL